MLCSRRSTLGESPRWDDHANLVRWLDIDEGLVLSVPLEGGGATEILIGPPCGSLVLHADNGLVVARGDSWMRVAPEGLGASAGSTRAGGIRRPLMRFNDAGVDSEGMIWSATMRVDESMEGEPTGALYRVGRPIEEVAGGLIAGNGVAWSPDEATMYVVDSGTNAVLRASFSAARSTVGPLEPWLAVEEGIADGIAVDVAGGVWVAQWGTGSVRRYDQRGELTHIVIVPTAQVTAVTFAGPTLELLVITSAAMGTDATVDPYAGALFVADAPLPGCALNRATW